MSAADDLADQFAAVGDGHPEEEEGGPRVELVQEVEQVRRLALERSVRLVPARKPEPAMNELVPVLEVDREQKPWFLHRGRL